MSDSDDLREIGLDEKIEAILFVAEGLVSSAQLSETLNEKPAFIEKGLVLLDDRLKKTSGIRLQRHGNKYQLTSAPELGGIIEVFLGLEATARLTNASLETLAIIAYKQPITRPAIDAIRGVNSDGVLKSLLFKGMIEELGRSEGPGRAILFGTTPDFLSQFGLNSLADLPDLNLNEEPESPKNHVLKD
jgi:segregation and condensation protein B